MAAPILANTPITPTTLLRLREVCILQGKCRSGFYESISAGLMTRPVKLGAASAWPAHEVEAINRARVAGKTDKEIRQLVKKLEESRSTLADYVFAG